MSSFGPVVSEEKMFENVEGRQTDGRKTDDGRQTPESLVYYKLTNESSAQVS